LVGAFADLRTEFFSGELFAEFAECAVPRINVQLVGVDQSAVDIEYESEQGRKTHVLI
jgi:hypothetical protein